MGGKLISRYASHRTFLILSVKVITHVKNPHKIGIGATGHI